jgi:hypothetical protein
MFSNKMEYIDIFVLSDFIVQWEKSGFVDGV